MTRNLLITKATTYHIYSKCTYKQIIYKKQMRILKLICMRNMVDDQIFRLFEHIFL